jgi:hypothetical protein
MNLLKETRQDIELSGHTPEDIIFIGSEQTGHRCTWAEFEVLADVEYDAGFGAQEVASDLIIVFSDGARMWRHEYDGSEEWSYSFPFKEPAESKPIRRLVVPEELVGWCDLAECNADY